MPNKIIFLIIIDNLLNTSKTIAKPNLQSHWNFKINDVNFLMKMTIYIYYFGLNNFLSYHFCFCTIQMLKKWKNYTKTYINHTYQTMSMVLVKKVRLFAILNIENCEKHTFHQTHTILTPKNIPFKNRTQLFLIS